MKTNAKQKGKKGKKLAENEHIVNTSHYITANAVVFGVNFLRKRPPGVPINKVCKKYAE
jgi:hypothetical protein